MTHLLGSKNCIDSLCKDITNMQETFDAIEKKLGTLDFSSWKFPSKRATDLNIEELLDDYSYCKDEEANRLSHLILFELVIDRFCALLQGVVQLFDNVFVLKNDRSRPMSRTVTSTMSIGLVTKMFWNKVSQVQYTYQNMEKELSDFNQSLMTLESSYLEIKLENDSLRKNSSKVRTQKNERIWEEKETTENDLENKNFSASTQTYETAFVPCDACARMQSNLIQVGSEIIEICESQELPSSLSKHKKLLKDIQMTSTDAIKWGNEQEKDLQKINKHLSGLRNQIDSLKVQLAASKSTYNSMKSEVDCLSEKTQQLKVVNQTLENENHKLVSLSETKSVNIEKLKDGLHRSEMTITELKTEKEHLNELFRDNQKELEKCQGNISALEQGMKSISSQLDQKIEENTQLLDEQRKQDPAMEKLKDTTEKLQQTEEKLKKIAAENKVLLKHDQGLQTKQATLLTRLENLNETCEDLRNQLEDLNDDNEKLRNTQKSVYEEKENLSKERDALKVELFKNQALSSPTNTNATNEIIRLSDQLKLLVSYPVIGSDYKRVETDYIRLISDSTYVTDSCSDLTRDMEMQLKANNKRISILQQQNVSLKNSLMKLDNVDRDTKSESRNNESLDQLDGMANNHTQSNRPTESNSAILPKPPNEPRSASKLTRPWSGNKNKKESFDIGAKLANLERLKNLQPTNVEWDNKSVPKTAWDEHAGTYLGDNSSVTCPDCDRTYLSSHDLDIHKAFCYGKI